MDTKKIFLPLVLAASLYGFFSQAQIIPEPLSLNSSPHSPSPGQEVAVQAATPTFDKHAALFTWTVDGKQRPDFSGQGRNEIRLTAGDVGSVVRVSVAVSPSGGPGSTAALTIRVSGLSLVWSAETSIPRWYKGKTLPSAGSVVGIAAVPEFVIDGRRLAPENLIYRWTLDDQTNALSGLGEQVFRVKTSDIPKTQHQVELVVEDRDKKIRKNGRITITPANPRAVIYPSTPLGGIEFRTAQSPLGQTRGLMDFTGEAFFFPVSSKQDLSWSWDIGGALITPSFASPYLATIDTAQYPQGSTPLTLRISYAKGLIPQSASKVLNLFLP